MEWICWGTFVSSQLETVCRGSMAFDMESNLWGCTLVGGWYLIILLENIVPQIWML